MRQTTILLTLLLALSGCERDEGPTVVETVPVGELVASREIPTSWNDDVRSEVTTTRGVFTVYCVRSGITGASVELRVYSNARTYLCTSNAPTCSRVMGF
jgi:hypothetical protein